MDISDEEISIFDLKRISTEYSFLKKNSDYRSKRDSIRAIINESYLESREIFHLDSLEDKERYIRFYEGQEKIQDFYLDILNYNYLDLDDNADIYYTGDIVDMLDFSTIGNLENNLLCSKTRTIKFISAKINEDMNMAQLSKYFHLISSLSNVRFELYRKDIGQSRKIYCLSQDAFMTWTFKGEDLRPKQLFLSRNQDVANLHLEGVKKTFEESGEVFTVKSSWVRQPDLFKNTKGSKRPLVYMSKTYLYIGPVDLCEDLYKAKLLGKGDRDIWRAAARSLKQVMDKNVQILLPKAGLDMLINKGYTYKADGFYRLYGEYLRRYNDHISQLIRSQNVMFYDKETKNGEAYPEVAIYADGAMVGLWKINDARPYDLENVFYQSEDEKSSGLVYSYVEEMTKVKEI